MQKYSKINQSNKYVPCYISALASTSLLPLPLAQRGCSAVQNFTVTPPNLPPYLDNPSPKRLKLPAGGQCAPPLAFSFRKLLFKRLSKA